MGILLAMPYATERRLMFRVSSSLTTKCTLIIILFSLTGIVYASFNKNLWTKWKTNSPLSTQVISHEKWQYFLDRHVSTNEEQINLVDYEKINQHDLNLLNDYLRDMSKIDIDDYNQQEQLAYWLNLYNAMIVKTVSDYYPLTSIQEINISPGLFSEGPWGAKLIRVKNTPLSLDDINNRIIRPIWNDPRTLYCLSDSSIGGPNLSRHAYHGEDVAEQLNQAASRYINSHRGAQVIEGKLIISKLYAWYQDDFGEHKKEVLQHLKRFAKEPLLSQLKHINTIDSYIYNWHLNCLPAP